MSTTSNSLPSADASTEYVPFIIVSAARTGSNMLASSLNSSPEIICFRELFNWLGKFIDYNVEGYDRSSPEDQALRQQDFRSFLRKRIFCPHPKEVRAVGFKMPHDHFSGFEGLLDWLANDTDIRVVHLKRRNQLRMLVSWKYAWMTGSWVEDRKQTLRTKFRLSNAPGALRDPRRAVFRLWRFLRPRRPWQARREPLTLSVEECQAFYEKTERDATYYGNRFREHPELTVYYEDLVSRRRTTLDQVQTFLGAKPRRLDVTTRQQNPEPLRNFLANYDELYEAFKDTPYAAFFD